jgi:hypothetical protein
MHDTETKPETATEPRLEAGPPVLDDELEILKERVDGIAEDGNLEALIAVACEAAMAEGPTPGDDPGRIRHAGARAAIEAYAAWKRAEGRDVPIDVVRREPGPEPEILPLSLAGKWVAWSSDGMRIVAAAETSVEAVRLANEAGEPEPILEPHPGRYRLL